MIDLFSLVLLLLEASSKQARHRIIGNPGCGMKSNASQFNSRHP
jgi:hypothetical protein